MKRVSFSPGAFLVAFCVTYSLVFALNLPLFLYYPLVGKFAWGHAALSASGPAMAWYGFLADAALMAAFGGLVVPSGVIERALRNWLWLFPFTALLVCVLLLRHFF